MIYFYGLLNGLLFDGISKISIVAFWAQDFTYFVLIPLAYLTYAFRKYNFKPTDYGLIKGSPAYPTAELIGASIFVGFFLGVLVLPLDSCRTTRSIALILEYQNFPIQMLFPPAH